MRAFIRRVVNAIAQKPESPDVWRERERRKEAARKKHQPVVCDVCGLEGHDRANCWAVIKDRADIERTWSGSRRSTGEGDTFQLMREWWRRMEEER